MVRIPKRGVKCLENKVHQAYHTQIIGHHKKHYELILKRCYEKIRNIIWIQNHNLMIVMLTEKLNFPKELIKIIQNYAKDSKGIIKAK